MIKFSSIYDLVKLAKAQDTTIGTIILQWEAEETHKLEQQLVEEMRKNWQVMQEAIEKGLHSKEQSISGLSGGDSVRLYEYSQCGNSYVGSASIMAAGSAIGVSEVNATMGRIVACPTAGSCGILPGAVHTAAKRNGNSEDEIIDALFTAAGIGVVIEHKAFIAGAAGGCQAECGAAAGMAAGALVQLAGGSQEQVAEAMALALKNLLGLACDPVAGLVEVPCVKRNGFIAVHAMLAADMAMAGIKSVIPADEVIEAMKSIGCSMPSSIRETATGGLAVTATGKQLHKKIFG